MGVFHVFCIVQMVPNRAKRHIWSNFSRQNLFAGGMLGLGSSEKRLNISSNRNFQKITIAAQKITLSIKAWKTSYFVLVKTKTRGSVSL